MDAITMIKERRSIRNFTEEIVDRDTLSDIISTCMYAPSWGNLQIVRYTVIDKKEILQKIASTGLKDFKPNIDVLLGAAGAIVLTNVTGQSGHAPDGSYSSTWEKFDAGIACQTLCLAAHEKGIGTLIMGLFDDNIVGELINIPQAETVSAIVAYGYEESHPKARPRKNISEIVRYL